MEETDMFRVLASADRQILFHELLSIDKEVTTEELSRQVAARRHQITPENISREKVKNAQIRLIHVHLPLLLDLNIIKLENDKVALAADEYRDQLLEAAEVLEDWPPNDGLRHPPS